MARKPEQLGKRQSGRREKLHKKKKKRAEREMEKWAEDGMKGEGAEGEID